MMWDASRSGRYLVMPKVPDGHIAIDRPVTERVAVPVWRWAGRGRLTATGT
jgi:hypothetical protein